MQLDKLTDQELLQLEQQTRNEVSRLDNLQQAKKVCLNSAYGSLGNKYFRFFMVLIASAITTAGELSIKWSIKDVNYYLNKICKTSGHDYILAADTDSMYIHMGPMISKFIKDQSDIPKVIDFMDKVFDDKIQPVIDDSYTFLADYTNAYEQKMHMKRELLADKAIYTAKKRYIVNIWNDEGVALTEPKMKITGLEAIKSTTPSACRDKIKEAIKIILSKDNATVVKYIEDFRSEFKELPIDEIAFPKSVNNILKWSDPKTLCIKGTPIHVRASLIYNKMLMDQSLDQEWELIKEGEKIKYIYLKEPNAAGSNVIAFRSTLPDELKLQGCIDYNKQFEKGFLNNLKIIMDKIGWRTELYTSIEDLLS